MSGGIQATDRLSKQHLYSMVMRTRVPRSEPRTAPTTTPVFEEPDEKFRRSCACAVWVELEATIVVRNVDAAALENESVDNGSF